MVLIANIDEENIEFLKKVSKDIGIKYIAGTSMTMSENGTIIHCFRPIFCENVDEGKQLIDRYLILSKERGFSLEKEQYFIKQ